MNTTHRMLAALGLALAFTVHAELPPQNLELRFRQVDSEHAAHDTSPADNTNADVTYSTRRLAPPAPPLQQRLLVLNGEWGLLRIGRSQAVRWTHAVAGQTAASGSQRGSVVNELAWLQADQGLAVRARWPGGSQPALVDIRVGLDQWSDPPEGEVPAQAQAQAATTVSVPLERWVTFAGSAADDAPDARGTLSTYRLQARPRPLFQVFVHVP